MSINLEVTRYVNTDIINEVCDEIERLDKEEINIAKIVFLLREYADKCDEERARLCIGFTGSCVPTFSEEELKKYFTIVNGVRYEAIGFKEQYLRYGIKRPIYSEEYYKIDFGATGSILPDDESSRSIDVSLSGSGVGICGPSGIPDSDIDVIDVIDGNK